MSPAINLIKKRKKFKITYVAHIIIFLLESADLRSVEDKTSSKNIICVFDTSFISLKKMKLM